MNMERKILDVSQVNEYIKNLMDGDELLAGLCIRGELSNYKIYPSGHHYFTLKDAGGALRCVMFRSSAARLRFRPENGMKVLAMGRITVFPRDGAYQLYCSDLTPDGVGDLYVAFEQLKRKLSSEGLFDAQYKKPLPPFPHRIAIITSGAGAAIMDMLRILGKRYPLSKVVILPVRVQGAEAPAEIAGAIRYANKYQVADVIITGRGGGSMEDLWAFNEEPVVRAIYASKIPVISAVGHETDFTLADFASDQRAATPSQAAELAVPDRAELLRYTESLMARLSQQERRQLQEKRLRLAACLRSAALQNPQLLLAGRAQRLDRAIAALESQMKGQMKEKRHALEIVLQQLDYLNPVHILRQGYGIVEKEGAPLTSVRAVKAGDLLTITLKDGRIPARAVKVQGEDNQEQ